MEQARKCPFLRIAKIDFFHKIRIIEEDNA